MSLFSTVRSVACGFQGRQQVRRAGLLVTLRSALAMAALVFGAAGAQASSPIVIDDFAADTVSPQYKSNAAGNYTFYVADATVASGYVANEITSGAIGGQRTMDLNVDGTPGPVSLALTVGYLAQTASNELNVATNNPAGSYSTVALNYSILSGVNLADGTSQGILFQMPANDSASLDIDVTLRSGGVSGPTATLDQAVGSFTTMTNVALALSRFTPQAGFNMNNVTGISIVFNGQSQLPNVDFRVQSILVPVPEPSSIALLGIATVLCGGYFVSVRRRRRHAAAVA